MSITKNTDRLRSEVNKHIEADAVIQKIYWDGSKGCFIGCLSHDSDTYNACTYFGLTSPLLRIAETIFEHLPAVEARKFFHSFPDAVGCDGKDLSCFHWKFFASELRSLPPQSSKDQKFIDSVIEGMDLLASGQSWSGIFCDNLNSTESFGLKAALHAACANCPWSNAEYHAGSFSFLIAAECERGFLDDSIWVSSSIRNERLVAVRRQRDLFLRLVQEAPLTPEASQAIATQLDVVMEESKVLI